MWMNRENGRLSPRDGDELCLMAVCSASRRAFRGSLQVPLMQVRTFLDLVPCCLTLLSVLVPTGSSHVSCLLPSGFCLYT